MKPGKNFNVICKWCFLLLLSAPVIHAPLNGQDQEPNSASGLLRLYFDNVFGDDERLITGHFYYGPAKGSIKGHPYYFDDIWKKGTIKTDDAVFEDLRVKYDVCINRLIINYTTTDNASYQIGLNSGKIKKVEISGREFIPLPGSSDSTGIPFAQVISDGPVKYLVTREKSLEISSSTGSPDYEYKEYVRQYLYHDGTLQRFISKNTLYRTFPEIKGQLRRFVRHNYLYLIRNKIDDRKMLVDYCNTLLSGKDE